MKLLFTFFLFFISVNAFNQNVVNDDTTKTVIYPIYKKITKKKQIAAYTHVGVITSSLYILNKYWYADYPRQKLSSFNDSKEWLQMDKMGHTFSTYLEARTSQALWKWSGVSHKKSLLLGGAFAMAYQTGFEVLDGLSAEYGFSWADMAANTVGAGLFISQELAWKEQRIQPKVSYSRQHYEPSLQPRIRNLYGTVGTELFLKDYNGQTHWYSANIKSFYKKSNFPSWLNIALGIGATGMLGGFENKWKDATGNIITRYDIKRQRQFYIAPDIDFTKIKTKKKALKVLFHVMNLVKFPAPGLEFTGGKIKVVGIAY
jgi:uncharacterized protein YfiM (DUF2279 family)